MPWGLGHVASTHWEAAQKGSMSRWTSQAHPGMMWNNHRKSPCWKWLLPIILLLIFSCPSAFPYLKVKPRKIIIVLWNTSNCAVHFFCLFVLQRKEMRSNTNNKVSKFQNMLITGPHYQASSFLVYLMKRLDLRKAHLHSKLCSFFLGGDVQISYYDAA